MGKGFPLGTYSGYGRWLSGDQVLTTFPFVTPVTLISNFPWGSPSPSSSWKGKGFPLGTLVRVIYGYLEVIKC